MRARMGASALALLASLVLTGCGTSESDRVRSTLDDFGRAVARHDVQTLCDRILSPDLISAATQATQQPCEITIRGFFQAKNPRLRVVRVKVDGRDASAVVRTTAANQEPSTDTIQLVKVGSAWRVSSLGNDGGPRRP